MKTVVFNSCTYSSEQKYIYASVPYKYINIVKELLYLMADYGKHIIDDCNYICTKNGKLVFESWNSFQIALESIKVNRLKDADTIFNNVSRSLEIYDKVITDGEDFNIYINKDYICIYHRILKYIANLDSNKFVSCNNICNCNNKFIIKLLNIFYSALANYNLNNYKVAKFFINYVDLELKKANNEITNKEYSGVVRVEINDKQHLLSYVTCGDIDKSKLEINPSTGNLLWTKKSKVNYVIKNNKYLCAYPQKGYVCNILNVTLDDEQVITAEVTYKENPEFDVNVDTGELIKSTYSDIVNGDYKLINDNLVIGYGKEI